MNSILYRILKVIEVIDFNIQLEFMQFAQVTDYKHPYNNQDLQLCKWFSKEKPDPVPKEFLTLVSIIMEEENLHMPNNCSEALELYLDLLNFIQ